MADLSSCYFCGAAMDVPLREHPVVPAAFSPSTDRQTTVVLCGTCERKLERVLDPVVDAAAAQRRAAATDASNGNDSTAEDATGTDDDVTPDVPPGALSGLVDAGSEDADETDTGNAERTDAGGSETGDGTPFEVDDTASVFDDGTDETPSDSVFADDSDAPSTTIPDAEADRDASDASTATDGVAFDDQSTGRGADDSVNATNAGHERTTTTTTTDDGPDGSASNESDTPDVDPRTYNKVVRLLKNRDLPVARTEIESIAGSAYDIPDHECEAIIDAAIQRGLVAEDGSELTYPDGV